MISVVLPIYNQISNIEELHRRLVRALSDIGDPYEVIMVDDGSNDGTRQKLTKLPSVTAVLFSRHFGSNAALDAGFNIAIGDLIITLDEAKEISTKDISSFIQKLKEGYGAVVGWRKNKRRSLFGRIISSLANWLVRKVTKLDLHDFRCPMKGYRREFIDGLRLFGETFIFVPVFAHDRGAKLAEIEVDITADERGYSFGEILQVLFALINVKFILNYFARPLRFFGNWAFFFSILTVLSFVAAVVLKIMQSTIVSPALLPLVGVMFAILSVILFMLGFIAEILLRIYYENKDSSPYMIYEIVKNK